MERKKDFIVTKLMAPRKVGTILRTTVVALTLTLNVMNSQRAACQEGSLAPVRIQHQPVETHKLPPAGSLMPISVQLANSSEVDIKIRLVGSRDGRFMDIAFPMGVLNTSDQPTYTIQIPAPTKAMTYQFIIHQRDGNLTLTDKFTIKRNCVQTYKVDVPEGSPSAEYRKGEATLIAKARSLERDTQNLDTAIKLLDGLKKDIPD
mgnify:CR=1 FL=1